MRIGACGVAPAIVSGWADCLAEGGREEVAEAPCESRPVATSLLEGRVEVGARSSRLEDEAEGTCDVGVVEPRLVEGLVEARCDAVG